MAWTGKIGETLRALVVLALFFLNFAHVPLSAAPADAFAPLSVASICGDPIGGDRTGDHAPCHACRIGAGADLPPPCPLTVPALFATGVDYSAVLPAAEPALPRLTAKARAPPAA
ncbi:MAG TPA: hypothetical protein PK286_00830 [Devosia sp.]|nr:hypothetical protein [Devosia sp.]